MRLPSNRVVATVIVTAYALLCTWQALLIPPLEGDSEFAHYGYARFIANQRAIPLPATYAQLTSGNDINRSADFSPWHQSTQPPGYYMFVALATFWVTDADSDRGIARLNFAHSALNNLGLPSDNKNTRIHELGQQRESELPGSGYVLAIRIGRLVSVAMSVLTLLVVRAITLQIAPGNHVLAHLSLILLAAIPQFANTASTLSNDNGVIMFATMSLYAAVRITRARVTLTNVLTAGVLCGLTILNKTNGAWVILVLLMAIGFSHYLHQHTKWVQASLAHAAVLLVVVVAVSGWWFFRNYAETGHFVEFSPHVADVIAPASLRQAITLVSDNLPKLEQRFWYGPGFAAFAPPDWILTAYRVLYGIGLVGFAAHLVQHRTSLLSNKVLAAQVTLLTLTILFAFAGAVSWILLSQWALGRIMYPGASAFVIGIAAGWLWLIQRLFAMAYQRTAAAIALSVILATTATAGARITVGALGRNLSITNTIPTDAQATHITYIDDEATPVATLIAYDFPSAQIGTGDIAQGVLCWQSNGYTKRSFPYSVQLVGPDDARIAARESYHGLGTYPLTRWSNNEVVCDTTSLRITQPITNARAYRLVVSLFDYSGDIPEGNSVRTLETQDKNGNRIAMHAVTRLRVGPIGTKDDAPAIATFGDIAKLRTYSVQLSGETLDLTLQWQALQPATTDTKVFIHLLDASGAIVAQNDFVPDGGWFPMTYWRTNDHITDRVSVQLPVAGERPVRMLIGFYSESSGLRLPAMAAPNMPADGRIENDAIALPLP